MDEIDIVEAARAEPHPGVRGMRRGRVSFVSLESEPRVGGWLRDASLVTKGHGIYGPLVCTVDVYLCSLNLS